MLSIYYGEDEYSKNLAIQELKRTLGDEEMMSFNTSNLSVTESSFDELVVLASSTPFLAPSRLVILDGLFSKYSNSKKKSFDGWEKIETFVDEMPDMNHILIKDGQVRPSNPLFKRIKDKGNVREFTPLSISQVRAWIHKQMESRKVTIDLDAVNTLVEICGNNMRVLASEIEKISLYIYPDNHVTVEHVKVQVNYVKEENIFSMVDHILNGNYIKARLRLQNLLDDGMDILEFIIVFATQLRRLIITKDLMLRKIARSDYKKQIGTNSDYAVNKLVSHSSFFSMDQLIDMHQDVKTVDLKLRLEGDINKKRTQLELLVIRLSQYKSLN
jgi:DNA polymerase-3 subunit delta